MPVTRTFTCLSTGAAAGTDETGSTVNVLLAREDTSYRRACCRSQGNVFGNAAVVGCDWAGRPALRSLGNKSGPWCPESAASAA